ncbi:hypothetical protein NA57DRAFT_57816 [Rhizodiscina lignyota]|uniref:Uncharacterized protein n=1 Tax=Rhizodiscina lignyota TaxID=1504668 RepID=A0A9P4ICL5_9PEZI|nr:hypothetical protein NA57DRAFT_57816 [Rhizodiscina lignyota]
MTVGLPDDILHLVCDELSEQRDFATLFECASSSKRLAIPALSALYRAQHAAPVKGGSESSPTMAERLLVIQKWSILWRSIVLSSLSKTLFPYCKYIKVLDFRDLNYMFEDDMFRGQVAQTFFGGDLSKYHKVQDTPSKARLRGRAPLLDRTSIIDAIGEDVTLQTHMAEQITGPILASALVRWIPRLPRLRSLQLWDGAALGDERVANLITVHCPEFDDLSIYQWDGDDTDHKLSVFIAGLPSNHLHGFETISKTGIAAESFLSLNSHADSLRDLKLAIGADAVPHLGLLKGCTNLELLDIVDGSGTIDIEKTQNDVFLEMIVWLRDCHKLRELNFTKFLSAAALLAQVLGDQNIRLEHLKLDSYLVKDQRDFHLALTHQTNLISLNLEGNSDTITFDDRSTFVDSLSHLKELRDLKLVFRSDEVDLLTDPEISTLVENLPNLQELYISGYGVTDAVLEKMSGLRSLRSVNFFAVTTFTIDGLLDFVDKLGPGNQGLSVVIDMADPESALTEEEQNLVREALVAKVGGRLEYQLLRDYDAFYNSDEDSD